MGRKRSCLGKERVGMGVDLAVRGNMENSIAYGIGVRKRKGLEKRDRVAGNIHLVKKNTTYNQSNQ